LRHLGAVPERLAPYPGGTGGDFVRVKVKSRKGVRRVGGGLKIPNFLGLSMREAITKAKTLKLQVEIQGFGYVVRQSPAAGSGWRKGKPLTLILQG
jgi:hypothetical protein